MPEGHTLHRLAGQMDRLFIGRRWRVGSPQGRFAAGASRLTDRTPERAEAWGKQLFIHLGPDIWQIHLGLYGAFSFRGDESFGGTSSFGAPRVNSQPFQPQYADDGWIIPTAPTGAVRARIQGRHGWADLRGPSRCQVIHTAEYEAIISRLGPDPLRQNPGELGQELDWFQRNLARRRISIAAALMDQSVIAGVGNIYRAESLFVEKIAPDVAANELAPDRAQDLWARLTQQLRAGVAEGIIRTLDQDDPLLGLRGADVHNYRVGKAGRSGRAVRRHWVYQQQGTPCLRCGETIVMRQLQGRSLYWCPGCQRR